MHQVPALSLFLIFVLVHLGPLRQERRTTGPELSDAHSPDSEKTLARSFVWKIYLAEFRIYFIQTNFFSLCVKNTKVVS